VRWEKVTGWGKLGWAVAVIGLLPYAYRLLDAWANVDFVSEQGRWNWVDDLLNPWAGLCFVAVGFTWAFSWLAVQTEWGKTLVSGSSFRVCPIPGQGFTLLTAPETYAQLGIRNTGPLVRKCCVRLTGFDTVMRGALFTERLQARLLCWSSRERAAYGDHREWLDIPNDKVEHLLDVAAVASSAPDHFTIVAADPADRPCFGPGWYRLIVVIASESETPNAKEVRLLLGLHPRDAPVPAPLELYEWRPRGERLLRDG
jgi:hypothetical protein